MKKNYLVVLVILLLTSILTINSCKKKDVTESEQKISKSFSEDPIVSISSDKNGDATIKTKSGKEIKQSGFVTTSRKEARLSQLNSLNDTTTRAAITITVKVPVRIEQPNFIFKLGTKSSSSLSSSEIDGNTPGLFTFVLTRVGSYVYVTPTSSVIYIDDCMIRATPFIERSWNPVIWYINYRYTFDSGYTYTTQVMMSTYV